MSKPRTCREVIEATSGPKHSRAVSILVDRVERVLEVHIPDPLDRRYCAKCGFYVRWPCSPVRLLDGEDV